MSIVRTIYPSEVVFEGGALEGTIWDADDGGPVRVQMSLDADKFVDGVFDDRTFTFLAFPMQVNHATVFLKNTSTINDLYPGMDGGQMVLVCSILDSVTDDDFEVNVYCGNCWVENAEIVQGLRQTAELAIHFICQPVGLP
jgi:hypothetical protein